MVLAMASKRSKAEKGEMQVPATIITMMLLCDSSRKMVTMATLMVRPVQTKGLVLPAVHAKPDPLSGQTRR